MIENKDRVRVFIQSCVRKKGSVLHLFRQETHILRSLLSWLGYRPFVGFHTLRLWKANTIHLRQACFQSTKLFAHDNGSVFVFETMHPGWPMIASLKVHPDNNKTLKTIAAHPSLPIVAVCDLFETLYILDSRDTPSGHRLRLRDKIRLNHGEYDGSIGCLDFHASRPLLALGTKQRLVLVDIDARPRIRTNLVVAGFVHKVQFHNTEEKVLVADHQGCIALYDFERGSLRYLPHTGNPLSILVSASADLSRIVVSSGVSVKILSRRGGSGSYDCVPLNGYDQLQKGVALHQTLPMIVQNTSSLHKTAIAVTRTDPCWRNPWRSSLPARDPSTVFGTLILHPTVPLVLTVRPYEVTAFSFQ